MYRLVREVEEQKQCAYCGSKTRRWVESVILPADEPYIGNAEVISSKPLPFGGPPRLEHRVTRGTYRDLEYGHFCKLRCAAAFAQLAVNAGFRIKTAGDK